MSVPAEHPFDFDPTHGFGVEQLLAVRPPAAPPGFDEFWRGRLDRALQVDPRPQLSETAPQHARWRVHDLVYASTGDFSIGGWLLLPREGTLSRGLVVGHGYGGRDGPDLDIPVEHTAVLFPCFRGLSRSRRPPISSDPYGHVLNEIDSPERYILGGCVEDLWLAVSALLRLFPWLDGRIGYVGESFGGGVGALALAFDRRLDRGCLVVPTFGAMPLWLTLPTVGSARSVQNFQQANGSVLHNLSLFDAATAATRIAVPMLMAVARFDPAVAPPCQFAVANALSTSILHETVILDAGHFEYSGLQQQHKLVQGKIGQFFEATCGETTDAGAARRFSETWSS
jgi:cephalosporin-C deacetylase